MNKELNHLLDSYTDNENFDYSCYISIENKLKALEIIKKFVNIDMLMFKGLIEQKEYDLLKEVLL